MGAAPRHALPEVWREKMKLNICTVIVVATISLCGCSTKSVLVWESYTLPAIGKLATCSVGESLIEQGAGELAPEFELSQDTVVGKARIPKGRYEFYAENFRGIWFIGGDQYFYINKADQTVCVDGKDCTKVDYTLNKRMRTLSPDSFQQTLLYSGKIGNRITLSYREFTNGMARAVFSNSVDYDLSESTTVGYKGARLEIVKATNTEITYRVLSNFAR